MSSFDERIQVTDNPISSPGKCILCGYTGGMQSDGRRFVDFGFDLDFYGAIIFCDTCIGVIARKLGYESAEESEERALINANRVEQIQRLEAENDSLRDALSKLDFVPVRIDAPAPQISLFADEDEGPSDPKSDEQSPSEQPGIVSETPASPKSILGI